MNFDELTTLERAAAQRAVEAHRQQAAQQAATPPTTHGFSDADRYGNMAPEEQKAYRAWLKGQADQLPH
jgi:hypothetical protein